MPHAPKNSGVIDPARIRELVLAILSGEGKKNAYWKDFQDMFYPHVLRAVRRKGVRSPHLEEIANDTFTSAHRSIGTIDLDQVIRNPNQIQGWLAKIAEREATKYFGELARERGRIERLVSRSRPCHTMNGQPITTKGNDEILLEVVRGVWDRLSTSEWDVARLYFWDNKNFLDIAELLDIDRKTVRARLFRVLELARLLIRRDLP